MDTFNLEEYLSNGVESIVTTIMKATIKNTKESIFMMHYLHDSRKARTIRRKHEEEGEHIPPFLIASITTQCNLHCKGCYARVNQNLSGAKSCNDTQLEAREWGAIFQEATELGVGFILLAGGEPLMRLDVIKEAGKYRKILFPIFTNGTLLTQEVIELLDNNRNLIPILSLEGKEESTDNRRGHGTYQNLLENMKKLKTKGILFAASVTVTTNNLQETVSQDFVQTLAREGCKGIIYVEYVPVDTATKRLALTDEARENMLETLNGLRSRKKEMLLIAFPGDEKYSEGCLAAGRGFFHINAHGGAEPCPFSPFSDVNVKQIGVREALNSPLFNKLKEHGYLENEHIGGCVLFEQEAEVKRLLGH